MNLVTCSNIPHHFETVLCPSEIVLSDVDENADYKMLVDYHKFTMTIVITLTLMNMSMLNAHHNHYCNHHYDDF